MTAFYQSDGQSTPKAGARASHYDMAHILTPWQWTVLSTYPSWAYSSRWTRLRPEHAPVTS